MPRTLSVNNTQQHFPPALGRLPHAVFNRQKMLLATGINADDDQRTQFRILGSEATANPIRPNINPLILVPLPFQPGYRTGR